MSNDTVQPPLWVALAFSNITKRKSAIWLILASIAFTIGLGIWWLFFNGDWSWCAWTAPLPVWYALAMRWMDANSAWEAG
jgi:hypothetical protein